eukprot:1056990-Pelagomonas_calceolata.AAC.5
MSGTTFWTWNKRLTMPERKHTCKCHMNACLVCFSCETDTSCLRAVHAVHKLPEESNTLRSCANELKMRSYDAASASLLSCQKGTGKQFLGFYLSIEGHCWHIRCYKAFCKTAESRCIHDLRLRVWLGVSKAHYCVRLLPVDTDVLGPLIENITRCAIRDCNTRSYSLQLSLQCCVHALGTRVDCKISLASTSSFVVFELHTEAYVILRCESMPLMWDMCIQEQMPGLPGKRRLCPRVHRMESSTAGCKGRHTSSNIT